MNKPKVIYSCSHPKAVNPIILPLFNVFHATKCNLYHYCSVFTLLLFLWWICIMRELICCFYRFDFTLALYSSLIPCSCLSVARLLWEMYHNRHLYVLVSVSAMFHFIPKSFRVTVSCYETNSPTRQFWLIWKEKKKKLKLINRHNYVFVSLMPSISYVSHIPCNAVLTKQYISFSVLEDWSFLLRKN